MFGVKVCGHVQGRESQAAVQRTKGCTQTRVGTQQVKALVPLAEPQQATIPADKGTLDHHRLVTSGTGGTDVSPRGWLSVAWPLQVAQVPFAAAAVSLWM